MSLLGRAARGRALIANLGAACAISLLLSGCGGGMADLFAGNEYFSSSSMGVGASPRVTTSRNVPKGGGRYQVGKPYTVAGRTFVPREQPDLNETGQASWYGPAFHGRLTANGEVYDQYHLSGAHPTLPLPSYVRVTNIDNGASTIVRINDRGPFLHGRVVDVSRRTAEVLGFINKGVANVRVQYVGPAPLEGDDSRFLVASINQLTPYETQTRMAYQQTQVAQTAPAAPTPPAAPTALQAVSEAAPVPPPGDIPFQVLSYAGAAISTTEFFGRSVSIDLGAFDPVKAHELAQGFATLGAVEQAALSDGTVELKLAYLREGVTDADVQDFARTLGLTPSTLY